MVARDVSRPRGSLPGCYQKLHYSARRKISEVFVLANEACGDFGHPRTEYLLYATCWFRSILSELIGAATENANVNRDRAPSGPVKVVVFFPSGMADHALRLGPYMRRSCK